MKNTPPSETNIIKGKVFTLILISESTLVLTKDMCGQMDSDVCLEYSDEQSVPYWREIVSISFKAKPAFRRGMVPPIWSLTARHPLASPHYLI